MTFQAAQLGFPFFFRGNPYTRIRADCDLAAKIAAQDQSVLDTAFIVLSGQSESQDCRLVIFASAKTDHDTAFLIKIITKHDTVFVVASTVVVDHDTLCQLAAPGAQVGHATLFIVRNQDQFTN